MTSVYNKAVNSTVNINRIIGTIQGDLPGPTLVIFGGIHGNETSGIFALKSILESVNNTNVKGTIYAISGNLKALEQHQRFIDKDLNRYWTKEHIEVIKQSKTLNTEESELQELLYILEDILKSNEPPFYFIDLHTTSSKTFPFITLSDALINRKFAKQFPVPIVLGIEEYLNGALLSYINELGYVSLGFESGQHDAMAAINNHIAFINLALVFSGIVLKQDCFKFSEYYEQLQKAANNSVGFFEIVYLYKIQEQDTFKMINGFESFQPIAKGTKLAINNNKVIESPYKGSIFMPLYQKKGTDGFFIIKHIAPFFLKLSTVLRLIKFDNLLVVLPGISWLNKNEGVLQVNLKIARFFAKSFFHLLGYRSKQFDKTHLRLKNRERVAKTEIYKNESWY
ncbi:succinylglutamate desuccinylase/aspartoacylase family protein [Aestuariibaculum sp. YM273]|uniref:succinylglutamate desuccinylase/aspartoacylase family protein n=1 Tax=Aestuariibaculum sp. YM273 TaxID=3070659 RepID=UPI0027DCDF28|nr:succinylglutamate desuccinylase/aspartoacylase family protein [Aestuariibaculum sp. YM273]WMI66684.1 succinylglutamate desuccinylase/aspartoacylase family protein [Aestuariibaculum sp. YM273]